MFRPTRVLTFALALAGSLLASPFQAGAAVLGVLPTFTSVTVGQQFVLDVVVERVDDLYAFDVELGFDDGIIRALSATPGTFLGTGTDVDDFSEFIDGPEVSGARSRVVFPGVTGGGILYSVLFRALAVGSTAVAIDPACDANDPFCSSLRDSTDTVIPYDWFDAVVEVTPRQVPEPASMALLAIGLGMAGRRLRRS